MLQPFFKFQKNTENTLSDLYYNEQRDYSVENTSDNEEFHSNIFQPFQFEPELKYVTDY